MSGRNERVDSSSQPHRHHQQSPPQLFHSLNRSSVYSSLSEVHNQKRQSPAASTTVVGFTELCKADGWRIWQRQDVQRSFALDIPVLFEQSASGNVCVSFSQPIAKDDSNHTQRDHG